MKNNTLTCFAILLVSFTILAFAVSTVIDPAYVRAHMWLTAGISFVVSTFVSSFVIIADEAQAEGYAILPSNI